MPNALRRRFAASPCPAGGFHSRQPVATSSTWWLAAAMLFGLLLPAPAAAAEPVTAPKPAAASTDNGAAPASPQTAANGTRTVAELTRMVRDSVVVITFEGRNGKTAGLGSGFVISKDGLIATNLHVIGEARPISVQTADGKTYPVQAVHASQRSLDLAVLQIEAKNLTPLVLGDSDSLEQGQPVVAIGNPQGLKHSVVSGVLSGRREIDGKPMLQIAMPIEQGNSGGPLLDMQGRVHGILTLKSLVTRNLGFAVTVNALKPLLEKPNPVPMNRWLTIGTLDEADWTTLFGAQWRQRAGRILVSGRGEGFGGRVLALSRRETPELPFEMGVEVKLDDEEGAAGLVFHADGGQKHYGFYPTNGKLRLSRFEGADVFSWRVLEDVSSRHYHPGEFNALRVRIEAGRIRCYVNDALVIDSTDTVFTEGSVGLASFRQTEATFRQFRVGKELPPSRPDAAVVAQVTELVQGISPDTPPEPELVEALLPTAGSSTRILEDRARLLEKQARRLRELADQVHEQAARAQLVEVMQAESEGKPVDLLRAALLIARIDNPEVDVEASLARAERIVSEARESLPEDASPAKRLAALDKLLFEELGFHGSRTNYYSSSNSYLNEVIDDREGLPIALSVLYLELARRLDLKIVGVGLPGHFIVRYEPEEGESQLIDPFERGLRLTRDEAIQKVKSLREELEWDDEYLREQSAKEIVERMLQNLMGIARDKRDSATMLRYVETLSALNPDSPDWRWFRAVLRYQTDRFEPALEDVGWLLERDPPGISRRQVEQLQQVCQEAVARQAVDKSPSE
ncbi:MAG: tetratricopeptide repeat protein [Planctomycetaceae bacterium]|nr:tetratricopeptide repeat protein [Planctomycetaceae bacterium]